MGKEVSLLALKHEIHLASYPADVPSEVTDQLKKIMEFVVKVDDYDEAMTHPHANMYRSFCSMHLSAGNPNIHPPRLYSLFKDYVAGETFYDVNPLFYEEMTDEAGDYIQKVNDERMSLVTALEKCNPKFQGTSKDVMTMFETLYETYHEHCSDSSTMLGMFRTNEGYKGLRCPMKQIDDNGPHHGKWVPDFTNRYFTEDIPLGLVTFKGLAQLLGVETPTIDAIIVWAQKHLQLELMTKGADGKWKLDGADVAKKTSAPQRFGIDSVDELVKRTFQY
jgi:hypothetical protein